MVKRVFVPLEDLKDSEALLEKAIVYSKHFQAHMDVLRAVAVQRPRISNPLLARWPVIGNITSFPFIDSESMPEIKEYVRRYETEVENSRQAYRDVYAKACKAGHIDVVAGAKDNQGKASASWISYDWDEADSIIGRYARMSDLSIIARPRSQDRIWTSQTIHHILFDAAKPIILMPVEQDAKKFDAPKHIAIAWNGSNEASHAVSAAMPLLKTAEKITIFTYSSKKTTPYIADDLQIWLKLHGIETQKVVIEKLEVTSVGASLLSEIEERAIDLMVTGAYGHSRMREFVLGGVTTYLLSHCPIALFMAR